MPATTRLHGPAVPATLYLAFELGNSEWKLAMTTGLEQPPVIRTIPARGLAALTAEIARAKAPFGLAPTAADHLAVVVEEWIANVVEHGGPQAGSRIVLDLRLSGGVVRLLVSDGGRAFDPRTAIFRGPNPERGGGAGLAMIAGLSRIAGYERRAGRNRLVLEMPLA